MSLCVVCVCVCGKEKEKLFFYLFFYFFLLLLSLPRYGQHVCQKLSLRERRQEISRLVKRGERGEKGVRALSIKTHFFLPAGSPSFADALRRKRRRSWLPHVGWWRPPRPSEGSNHCDDQKHLRFLSPLHLVVCVCMRPSSAYHIFMSRFGLSEPMRFPPAVGCRITTSIGTTSQSLISLYFFLVCLTERGIPFSLFAAQYSRQTVHVLHYRRLHIPSHHLALPHSRSRCK